MRHQVLPSSLLLTDPIALMLQRRIVDGLCDELATFEDQVDAASSHRCRGDGRRGDDGDRGQTNRS